MASTRSFVYWPTGIGHHYVTLAEGEVMIDPTSTHRLLHGPATVHFYRHADGAITLYQDETPGEAAVRESDRWDPEVDRMLVRFRAQFFQDMEAARASGAVPADATEVELARAVLGITAAKFRLLSPRNRRLASNLRRLL